ncbi:MAG: hypothetical protein GTO05_09865, partial [Gemmatimonadales bacterium]|nr:hypothetical protein [Gemmatimonadales bacterium]
MDGPFDDYFHTPDLRQLRGSKGRYDIPKINFHLFRLRAFEVNLATPVDLGTRRFTFDPSGRDIPLFRPSQLSDPTGCRPTAEWEVRAAIPCRLLGAASYRLGPEAATLDPLLEPLVGERFIDEARLRRTLLTILPAATLDLVIGHLLSNSITSDSPKLHLIPEAVSVLVGEDSGEPAFAHEVVVSGDLEDWGASLTLPVDKRVVI